MSSDLSDRNEIIATTNRLGFTLHQKRWAAYESLFTEDATADFNGKFKLLGRSALLCFVRKAIECCSATHHLFSNYVVDLAGDSADASCYIRVYHVGNGDKVHLFEESLGAFMIKLVRTADGWRVRHLQEDIFIMLGTIDIFRHGRT